MEFIAVCGKNGSGKSTTSDLICALNPTFVKINAREFILKIAKIQGVEIKDREELGDFIKQSGLTGTKLIERVLEENKNTRGPIVFESLRKPSVVKLLRELYKDRFFLIGIESDPTVRFNRIQQRRSLTNHITYEKFIAEEEKSTENQINPESIDECLKLSDEVIANDGNVTELSTKVKEMLERKNHFK